MAKYVRFQRGISSVFFWSVISAAFIGPGTVTTTSRSGALFGGQLLWALLFSTLATILLQETSARLTIASGKNLGEIIALQYSGKKGRVIQWAVFAALVFGCAAYEAGNLLGAVAGLQIFSVFPSQVLTLALGAICAALLWTGNINLIARFMGVLVALMGIAFMIAAWHTPLSAGEILMDSITPAIPSGAALLVIGLVGTTIVPYNLFLGSGIGQGQDIKEMRLGISIAVLIGGLISGAILLAGTQINGTFSFEALAETLSARIGAAGKLIFGFGLFAAGFSSATTAPLAAAVAARSLFGAGTAEKWGMESQNFRMVWGIVLGVGLVFGVAQVKPIPVIIIAQALNGLLLPFMAIFLLFAANDQALLGRYANGVWANICTIAIVGIAVFLGLHNIALAANAAFNIFSPEAEWPIWGNAGLSLLTALGLIWKLSLRKDASLISGHKRN